MKKTSIVVLIISIILISCSRGMTRDNTPYLAQIQSLEKKEMAVLTNQTNLGPATLGYNYRLFMLNPVLRPVFPLNSPVFFSALSNEHESALLFVITNSVSDDPESEYLRTAAGLYLSLTNQYTNELNFLYQRAGACYFKSRDYPLANQCINLSLMDRNAPDETLDNELYYYKYLLLAFHQTNYRLAQWYLNQVKPEFSPLFYLSRQDWLSERAYMESVLGNVQNAYNLYNDAINEGGPEGAARFYLAHSPVPLYVNAGRPDLARDFLGRLYALVTNKGPDSAALQYPYYSQLVFLNQSLKRETLSYDFSFPATFGDYNNSLLYYFYLPPYQSTREKSFNVQVPFHDKKLSKYDLAYYTFFEDFNDYSNRSTVFLTMAVIDSNFVSNIYRGGVPYVTRYAATDAIALILEPTNITVTAPNSTNMVVAKDSNVLFLTNLGFRYFYNTEPFDLDGDRTWDYVILGFNKTNEMVLSYFYPVTRKLQSVKFWLNTPRSKLVIQDLDGDGTNEAVLFDGDVRFLKMPVPLTNALTNSLTNNQTNRGKNK